MCPLQKRYSSGCRAWAPIAADGAARSARPAGRPARAPCRPRRHRSFLPSLRVGGRILFLSFPFFLYLTYIYFILSLLLIYLFGFFFCFVLSRFVSGFWMLMLNLRSASEMGISVSLYAQHGGCSFLAFRCTGRFSFSHFYLFVYLIGMVCFSGVFLEKKKMIITKWSIFPLRFSSVSISILFDFSFDLSFFL